MDFMDKRGLVQAPLLFFKMLHLSERQGMGGSRIFKATSDNKMRAPIIGTCPMATELTLWKTDIAQ